MQNKDNDEKIFDLKETIENFVEAELPELSQEEAIKAFKDIDMNINQVIKKKKNDPSEDDEAEDDEHLKRLKQELLESLKRVDELAKKIFSEKEKTNLKNIKVKTNKDKEKVIQQMKEKIQNDQERSREE